MPAARPVAVVVAMEEELLPFRALWPSLRPGDSPGPWETWEGEAGGRPVVVALSDCGPVNAAAALEALVSRRGPALVLSAGAAGAHDEELLPGDVVVGARYRVLVPPAVQEERARHGLHPKGFRFRRDGRREHADLLEAPGELVERALAAGEAELPPLGPWRGPGWPADAAPRAGRVVAGTVGSADAWTRGADELRALRAFYGTDCEDMESAFLVQLCTLHGLPFVSVRCVSNNELRSPLAPGNVAAAIGLAAERSARVAARIAEGAGRP